MRDFLLDLLDAFLFHPVVQRMYDHPFSVWIRAQPVWRLAILDVFVGAAMAAYLGVFMYLLHIQSPFWRSVAQLVFRL
jgi:hypothetical protein